MVAKHQVSGTGMYAFLYSTLAFFKVDCSLLVPIISSPANYTRTADQNVTSPTSTRHSAQHRTTVNSSAQAALGIINSLVAPNHGPFLLAPFTCFSCILPYASGAGGVPPVDGALAVCTDTLKLMYICKHAWKLEIDADIV